MRDAPTTSYDVVPYEDHPFAETHPDVLATVAALFGLTAPPVERCRVLELGCAAGGNLIAMALTLPGATFLGVDQSPRQIDDGLATVAALGLENVELKALDIQDVGDDFGEFDYILCHGVYSWVPEAVRAKVLAICAQNLAPHGVAYVSYNTYPGWHLRGMVRDMMMYQTRRLSDPWERARAARAFLDTLAASIPEPGGAFARVVREEAELIRPQADSYLIHEHLQDVNHPVYFHEFAAEAAAHGLQVLGDARFRTMAVVQPSPTRDALDRLASDALEREQHFDFLVNRRFRRTLLCRDGPKLGRLPSLEAVMTLRASAVARAATAPPGTAPADAQALEVPRAMSTMMAEDPAARVVLEALLGAWPRSLTFDAIWEAARPHFAGSRRQLAETLLRGQVAAVVDLNLHAPRFAPTAGDRPMASPLARRQAAAGPRVASLRHRVVELGDFPRAVLRLLDGTRDRPAILAALDDPAGAGALDACLRQLAGDALLMDASPA